MKLKLSILISIFALLLSGPVLAEYGSPKSYWMFSTYEGSDDSTDTTITLVWEGTPIMGCDESCRSDIVGDYRYQVGFPLSSCVGGTRTSTCSKYSVWRTRATPEVPPALPTPPWKNQVNGAAPRPDWVPGPTVSGNGYDLVLSNGFTSNPNRRPADTNLHR